ncbi:MAG: LysM peptidoglycan-binding domain-containing protein [Desulfobacteraceae bacterium]|nr:LysM peptidoglycan-binding domain-containing protein [Desulfobacteraceae bacterium]
MYKIKWIANITGVIIFLTFSFFPATWAQESGKLEPAQDSGFYYTIKKGDTLWDLSQKFYNSQWDWPGLWEMNKDIKNPHWIYPGKKIQIFLKSKISPKAPVVKAPPEPMKTLPPISPSFTYQEMSHIGFIKKNVEPCLGNIIREKDGNLMMSTNDIIYINPTGIDSLMPGKIYQIFDTEKIKEKIDNQVFSGIKHLIKAEIKVIEYNGNYAMAIITNSYRDANVGDKIMAFYSRDTVLSVQENPDPIEASIICSEDNTVLVNDYTIAFINKGKQDNILPGQIYSVLQENRSAFDGSDSAWPKAKNTIPLDPLNSGKLIVLHTEEIASTVMILSSKRAIYPGDMVN